MAGDEQTDDETVVRTKVALAMIRGLMERSEQYYKALELLDPANPEETLVGAIRNLQQAALSAAGNCDTMERRVVRLLRIVDELIEKEMWDGLRETARRIRKDCAIGINEGIEP